MKINRVDIRSPEIQERLSRLQERCLPNDEPFDTTVGYWWLVVTASGDDAGFAGLVRSIRWTDCAYLCRAGVLPAYRGQGVQKRLIRARLRQAKAIGMRWVVTDTYDNPASSNSLISTGFKLFKPSKPWGGDGTLYWKIKLGRSDV